jgi:hypothetical protein
MLCAPFEAIRDGDETVDEEIEGTGNEDDKAHTTTAMQ